jgi:hypothetical protein
VRVRLTICLVHVCVRIPRRDAQWPPLLRRSSS